MEHELLEDKPTIIVNSHTHTEDKFEIEANTELFSIQESVDTKYPDGGLKAWSVVTGAMCSCFATFGFVNSWGIFQDYYQRTLLKESSPSNIAWIGSFQYSLILFPALVFGRLFDLGYFRMVLLASSTILVLSTFLVAECNKYWHFLLCQGFAIGLASSGVVITIPTVVSHWFLERRGLALGFVAIGSAAGGTVIPIAAKKLLPLVGFKWTIRIIGFILTVLLAIANLVLKRRLPPSKNVAGGLFHFSGFKNPLYALYCISGAITYLGFYTVQMYIGVTAIKIGLSEEFSFYLVAISNSGSLFGRYAAGMLADRVAEFGGSEDLGRRTGMYFSIISLGALAGPPLSGVISSTHGGFHAVGWYAGKDMC
ncbi:major facilitator superfamily domain-containing protein [Cyathus striatus]|nr:major facilitator superfamily domain-containing protein [Cyathus striatus]